MNFLKNQNFNINIVIALTVMEAPVVTQHPTKLENFKNTLSNVVSCHLLLKQF